MEDEVIDNTLTIDQTITKGHGPCPDCGQRASIKTIRNHDHQGNPEPGYHIVIDCPDCKYYEFYYQGPDV